MLLIIYSYTVFITLLYAFIPFIEKMVNFIGWTIIGLVNFIEGLITNLFYALSTVYRSLIYVAIKIIVYFCLTLLAFYFLLIIAFVACSVEMLGKMFIDVCKCFILFAFCHHIIIADKIHDEICKYYTCD